MEVGTSGHFKVMGEKKDVLRNNPQKRPDTEQREAEARCFVMSSSQQQIFQGENKLEGLAVNGSN